MHYSTLNIRNNDDLKVAYWLLKWHGNNDERKEYCDNLKRKIRRFYIDNDMKIARKPIMVKDDGIDGYTCKEILPKWVFSTMEEAEQYFMEEIYVEMTYSAYDCTGRAFTAWHKIFDIGENFVLYHRICFDV